MRSRSALLVVALAACAAPRRPATRPNDRWARLDTAAASERENHALVGLAVGVALRGEVVFARGYGYEDRESKVPVDPRLTRFRWASVSKTVTAIILDQLAREGAVSWDAPTTTYVPGYAPTAYLDKGVAQPLPEAQRALSLRAVAGHLAGIPHYANGLASPEPPDPRGVTMEQALAYLAAQPLIGLPGAYSYSTFGFNLLGVVIEKVAHTTFDAAVEARINARLGTHIAIDHETSPLDRRAAGYKRTAGVIERSGSADVSWKAAGGGLISSVHDFARYCGGLDGTALLDPAAKQRMWTSQHDRDDKPTNYGIGFTVATWAGQRRIGHDGSQEKVRTQLDYFPDRHLCVVVMTNAEYASVGELASVFSRIALELTAP